MHLPKDIAGLQGIVADAETRGTQLEIQGGGTKAEIARPGRTTEIVRMDHFAGIAEYDPAELFITVGAGTKLAEIETLLAQKNQMLAFEPFDHASFFGKADGATIGGIVAANVSGARRVAAGAVRDHLLGFEAVSGRAEAFKAGGKVVKNVTGFDLSKLMAGSWGRIAVMTQMTLRVLPNPETSATFVVSGLSEQAACTYMNAVLGACQGITGGAHLPAPMAAQAGLSADAQTVLRLEGVAASIAVTTQRLKSLMPTGGSGTSLGQAESVRLWAQLSGGMLFAAGERVLGRINAKASDTWRMQDALTRAEAAYYYDWAGSQIWVSLPSQDSWAGLRDEAARLGGEANLVRASESLRTLQPVLHPLASGVAALNARVKAAFDPSWVLDPERFTARG